MRGTHGPDGAPLRSLCAPSAPPPRPSCLPAGGLPALHHGLRLRPRRPAAPRPRALPHRQLLGGGAADGAHGRRLGLARLRRIQAEAGGTQCEPLLLGEGRSRPLRRAVGTWGVGVRVCVGLSRMPWMGPAVTGRPGAKGRCGRLLGRDAGVSWVVHGLAPGALRRFAWMPCSYSRPLTHLPIPLPV